MIFLICAGLVIITSVIFLSRRRVWAPKIKPIKINKARLRQEWRQIESLLNYEKLPATARKDTNFKLAVIQADQLLAEILRKFNYTSSGSSDPIEDSSLSFPALKKVLWAHRVSELVQTDSAYPLKFSLAKKIINLYKKAFRDLKIL